MGEIGLALLLKRRVSRRIYTSEVTKVLILPSIPFVFISKNQLVTFLLSLPGLLASEGTLQQFSLLQIESIVLDLISYVHKDEGILDERLLNESIEWSIGCEARRVVYFQNDRLE